MPTTSSTHKSSKRSHAKTTHAPVPARKHHPSAKSRKHETHAAKDPGHPMEPAAMWTAALPLKAPPMDPPPFASPLTTQLEAAPLGVRLSALPNYPEAHDEPATPKAAGPRGGMFARARGWVRALTARVLCFS